MSPHRNNHYVPVWYQKRFIASAAREQKYYYLDLSPERITRDGHSHIRESVRRLGPPSCFNASCTGHGNGLTGLSERASEAYAGPGAHTPTRQSPSSPRVEARAVGGHPSGGSS